MFRSSTKRLFVALALTVALAGCSTTGQRGETGEDAERTRYTKAFEHMRGREFDEAETNLLALLEQTPKDAVAHTNLGIVYSHQGRLDDAQATLLRAIELKPRNAVAWNELGIVLRRAGDFADAEQAYRNAIDARPDYAFAHYNLGVLLDLYTQRRDQAIAHYEQYLALDNPDDKQVQAWVKDLQRRTGQGPSTAAAGGELERR